MLFNMDVRSSIDAVAKLQHSETRLRSENVGLETSRANHRIVCYLNLSGRHRRVCAPISHFAFRLKCHPYFFTASQHGIEAVAPLRIKNDLTASTLSVLFRVFFSFAFMNNTLCGNLMDERCNPSRSSVLKLVDIKLRPSRIAAIPSQ